MLPALWFDLKAAVRSLLRRPAFVTVAALTLAMGVGATTVAFALVNQVLLRPLPGVRDPDDAAYVQFAPLGVSTVSYPDFELLRENATLVDGMAYYARGSVNVTLDQARPVEVRSTGVAGDFFEVLGVTPLLGRLLEHADGDPAGDPFVVVISEQLWATLFDRAPDVAGKTIKVGNQTLMVVGVAGGGFAGAERGSADDLWMPWSGMRMLYGFTQDLMSREQLGVRDLVVRPRPGATQTAIEGQLDAILARAAVSFPESAENLSGIRAELFPGLHSPPLGRLRTYRQMTLLAGVVGLVLLIACANVANLLLFRGVTRRGEVATRRALGASTARLARQHVAESLVIALLGTTLGLAVGWVIGLPFRGFPLFYSVAFEGIAFDVRVLLFGGATVLLTTLLFGVVPAILAGRADPAAALAEAGTRETGRGSFLRSGMAAIQLALSLSLLVSALLLVRTLGKLYATDTGFSYERVATTYLELGDEIPVDERDVVMHEIVEAVKAVPGVQAAALADRAPFTYTTGGRLRRPEGLDSIRNGAIAFTVTPEWFDVLGVQAVSGSTLSAGDWQPGAPSRVIFSEGLARRYFRGENIIGRTITAGFGRRLEESEIYGVIPDLGMSGPGESRKEFFVKSPFDAEAARRVAVLARTTELNADVLSGITAAVERAVPQLPVPDAFPLRKFIDVQLAQQRLFARMIGLVAALSVLLAAVGLYGVVAFTVAGRRREMGIRLTLGADGRDLANLVARYALGVVGFGVALGLMGASWLENLLDRWIFDLVALDPVSYGASILMFVVVAVLACWVPTRSAMRVDPAVTLRAD